VEEGEVKRPLSSRRMNYKTTLLASSAAAISSSIPHPGSREYNMTVSGRLATLLHLYRGRSLISFSQTSFCAFFFQTSSADAVVAELEKRIASLEVGKKYDATKEAVEKVEKEFLVKLREIKQSLEETGSSSATNSKELQKLRAENAELKQKNQKLEYRVQHCVESMEEMYKFVES